MGARLLVGVIGAAGMGAQIGWARLSSVALGGTFAAAAFTLSGAMIGLAAGAAWGGRPRSRPGVAALAAAAAALVCPGTLAALSRLEGHPLVRTVLVGLLLTLAHAPFGAVLPAVAGVRGRSDDADLYGAGALGSAIGAVVVGGVLHRCLAVDTTGVLLGAAILAAGLLGRPQPRPAGMRNPAPGAVSLPVLALAFGLGFLGLASELSWTRALGFAWEASPLTFAWVAAAHVAGLAVGAWRAGKIPIPLLLGAASAVLGAAALAAPEAALVRSSPARLATALALVGLPAAAAGAVFARLLSRTGATAPLLAANAAGSAVGPLAVWTLADHLPWAPRVLLGLAVAYAVFCALSTPSGRLRFAPLATAAGFFLLPAGPSVGHFGADPERAGREVEAVVLPFVDAGAASTVVVSRDTRLGLDHLWIDRSHQGDTSVLGRRIPRRLGALPCRALGRPPGRTAVIGLGLGLTLSGLMDAGAGTVEVAELSGGVIRANRTILADVNGRVLDRAGVRVVREDGRVLLADAREPYDMIVVDMVFPSASGAGALFSREFYDLARRRLGADGLFVHWIPCSQLDPEDFASVVAGFLESFPDGSGWVGHLGPGRLILGLAGGRGSASLGGDVALNAAALRRISEDASPFRDADARMEYRSSEPSRFRGRILRRLVDVLPPESPWAPCAGAALAEEDGKPERARRLYVEAARRFPGATDAEAQIERMAYETCLRRAREAAARRDEASMVLSLRGAAAYGVEGRIALGDALAARGRFSEALAEFDRAAASAPRSADARLKAALAASFAGDLPRARARLEEAADLRPDRPPLFRHLEAQFKAADSRPPTSSLLPPK
ncbi:MAG TPA: fused MFS/spermidine synthase [Planctomycetota bacterium]|nr:fused MFS/spermidine synthase [Planctomycetota bacterium]